MCGKQLESIRLETGHPGKIGLLPLSCLPEKSCMSCQLSPNSPRGKGVELKGVIVAEPAGQQAGQAGARASMGNMGVKEGEDGQR